MNAKWKRNTVVATMAVLVCAAVALNWKLDSKELIQRMNSNVEKLRRCSFLDENYVDADQLIQWYQKTFAERNLEYDENGESDSKGDKNCG